MFHLRPFGTLGLILALAMSVGLTGCSVMRVDNQVQSHAIWPSGALSIGKVSYRFERLPSQQQAQQSPLVAELESWVAGELATHNWQLQPEGSDWRVTVSSSHTVLPRAPWESPPERWHMGIGLEGGRPNRLGLGMWMTLEQPYHLRAVSVVIRDGQRGEVVYETQARHDGRWNDSPALWQAMVKAALSGFPNPPAGLRQVDLDVPR